jgi:hypothetical protein
MHPIAINHTWLSAVCQPQGRMDKNMKLFDGGSVSSKQLVAN